MKKSVKLLILGLMFIVGFNEVKAIDFSEGASFSIVKDGTVTADGLRYGNYTYNGEIKYHSSVNGKDYVTYCEDPHLQGGGSYTVDRILGADSQHDEVNSYDHGILAILANGYNQFNSSLTLDNGTVVSGNDLYLATSLAQRAFTMGLYGWGGNATLSAAYQAKGSSLINLGVHWATIYSGMGATEIVPGLNSCTTNDQACIQRYIAGKYGSGSSRMQKLGKYAQSVQAIVNYKLEAISYASCISTLKVEVLKGNLGNGALRKSLLGAYYNDVQNLIG